MAKGKRAAKRPQGKIKYVAKPVDITC